MARTTAREAMRARRLPTVAVGAVLGEVTRRAGPALAMGRGDGATHMHEGAGREVAAAGLLRSPLTARKRPAKEASDERGSTRTRARYIL